MKFSETSLIDTRIDTQEIVKLLVDYAPYARVQADKGAPGVRRAFRELALSEKCQERGEILTRIMQLPPQLAPILMEYIQKEGPWNKTADVSLKVKLRNNDTKPHQVIYEMWWQPAIDENTGEELIEDGWPVYEKTIVGVGETIELTPHWAFCVLRKYCKRAANPAYWSKWETIGDKDCFEEIGFSCSLPRLDKDTPPIETTAPPKPRRRSKRAEPQPEATL
jgi:hypothetical protein